MRTLLLLASLLLATCLMAADVPDTLTTTKGVQYSGVQLLSSNGASITISHSGGTSTIEAADLPKDWRVRCNVPLPVPLGKYRLGETLEQCQARYLDMGHDLPQTDWKQFKKNDFLISVHFTNNHADEIQYKRWNEGRVIPLEEPERLVLLGYNGERWDHGENHGDAMVYLAQNNLVARYGLETTDLLDAGVLTIFTREREIQQRADQKQQAQATKQKEEEAAKQRLKGL